VGRENKKIKRILLDEVPEEEVHLIALFSSTEIFRIVYHLNKVLSLRLKRTEEDIDIISHQMLAFHPLYHFYDEINDTEYYFIANKSQTETEITEASNLFQESVSFPSFIIPERKKVDYFLKIERGVDIENLLEKLKEVKQISAFYLEEITGLKSYKNLIFD